MERVIKFVKDEAVFVISMVLALGSSFIVTPGPEYAAYIDYKVITCLFCLMLTVCGFVKLNIFEITGVRLLKRADNTRKLSLVLIFVTYFSSMLVTNDVALITFVPLTMMVLRMCGQMKNAAIIVVLQTVAANIGSCLTPVGNPQNLYLYSYYNMGAYEFFSAVAPTAVSGGVLLLAAIFFIKNESFSIREINQAKMPDAISLIMYALLFVLSILAVFSLVNYLLVCGMVIIAVTVKDRELFRKVDYLLLLTFCGFFIFVGNISRVDAVREFFINLLSGREFLSSVACSQVISNVPAAILLSGFTESGKSVLAGVNVGGLGTLIASLASVISYKLYCRQEKGKGFEYIKIFTAVNIAFLIALIAANIGFVL